MKYQLEEGCLRVNREIDKIVKDPETRKKEHLDSTTLSRLINGPSDTRKEAINRVYGEDAGACRDFKIEADRLAAELGRVRRGYMWPDFKTAIIMFCALLVLSFSILTPFYIDDVERIVKGYGADRLREEEVLHKYMMESKDREIEGWINMYNQVKEDKKIGEFYFFGTEEKRKEFVEWMRDAGIDYEDY